MTTWETTLQLYHDKAIHKTSLWPSWLDEVRTLSGLAIEEDRIRQAEPLFEHGWSPSAAAQHLRLVWRFKGWVVPSAIVDGAGEAR